MGSVADTIGMWLTSDEKENFHSKRRNVLLKWVNEAQLQFAVSSELLRDVWSPSVPSTGYIALPSNFIREFEDRVKRSSSEQVFLGKMKYEDASILNITTLSLYSIFNGKLYVWGAQACSPIIPYIKKPTAITFATLQTADLEIPNEYYQNIINFLNAKWLDKMGDFVGSQALMKQFHQDARIVGQREQMKKFGQPVIRSARF